MKQEITKIRKQISRVAFAIERLDNPARQEFYQAQLDELTEKLNQIEQENS